MLTLPEHPPASYMLGLREAKYQPELTQDSDPQFSVSKAISCWQPLVPPGEQKNDALIPSLADTTQFLALGLTLLFFLPSSQSWSTLRLGVAADGIASGFAGEGQEEFRASLEHRACIPSQWPQDLTKTMAILAAPSPEPCPGGLLSTTPPPVADIP